MQLNDTVEMAGAKFVLKNFNFWFDRSPPEFAIEVTAAPRATCVVFEAGGVAEGIDLKEIAFRNFGRGYQVEEKFCSSKGASGLIAVNSSEDADANGVAAVGSAEGEAGNRIFFGANFESTKLVGLNAVGLA